MNEPEARWPQAKGRFNLILTERSKIKHQITHSSLLHFGNLPVLPEQYGKKKKQPIRKKKEILGKNNGPEQKKGKKEFLQFAHAKKAKPNANRKDNRTNETLTKLERLFS